MTPEKAKKTAVKIIGRMELAKKLGITPQAISQWRKVPANHAVAISMLTGGEIKPVDLRPDVFSVPVSATR